MKKSQHPNTKRNTESTKNPTGKLRTQGRTSKPSLHICSGLAGCSGIKYSASGLASTSAWVGNTPARDSLRKSPPGPCCMLCGNTQACTRSPGFVFPTSRWTHHQKWGISEVILAGGGGNN